MPIKYKTNLPPFVVVIAVVIAIVIAIAIGIVYKNGLLKEGFESNTSVVPWSKDLIYRFNKYQATVNENVNQYNLEELQKQASPEEAEALLATGVWPWPENLKKAYKEAIRKSTLVKLNDDAALTYAMKTYNKHAAQALLAWNTDEGNFLLYGHTSKNGKVRFQCTDKGVTKTVVKGANLWNGFLNTTTSVVKPSELPQEIDGFAFLPGQEPCDPCSNIDDINATQKKGCQFTLHKNGERSNYNPWHQLWSGRAAAAAAVATA